MFKTIFLLCIFVASAAAEIEQDEGVYVLTADNFDSFMESHDFTLVEFYAPWCGHCKALAPEYAAAAKELAEAGSPIALAKVDVTENEALGSRFEIKGFPTLFWFRNGERMEYNGGRTSPEIVAWLKKKSGPPAVALSTIEEVESFKKESSAVLVGFFSDEESADAKTFVEVAAGPVGDSAPCGIVTDPSVVSHFGGEQIVMFQDFDDGKAVFSGDVEKEALEKFIGSSLLPSVVDFTEENAPKIFQGSISKHFLFFTNSADASGFSAAYDTLKELSNLHKGDLLFLRVDVSSAQEGLLKFFGITKDTIPEARIVDLSAGQPIKYKPESIDLEALKEFTASFVKGEAKPHLKSAPAPESQDGPVYVLVSSTFEEVAYDDSKDVLVEFYAPWCGHCKKLEPVWEELAETLKDNDKVVVAKMDATENELADVEIQGFPTIKFFPRNGGKTSMDYDGGREVQDFLNFLEVHASQDSGHDEL